MGTVRKTVTVHGKAGRLVGCWIERFRFYSWLDRYRVITIWLSDCLGTGNHLGIINTKVGQLSFFISLE